MALTLQELYRLQGMNRGVTGGQDGTDAGRLPRVWVAGDKVRGHEEVDGVTGNCQRWRVGM